MNRVFALPLAMNKVLTRLQALRDKAAQFKQVVDSAPAKAAQFRDAVSATTGQLQQLRADVQGTVASLRSDSDASLAQTLVELDGGIGTLARAGYELSGVDLEQGPTPRVIVHLDQVPDARTTPLETLLRETTGQRTMQAILQALIRAEALEEEVQLADLTFRGLIVHIGAVPTVRLCWRRQAEDLEELAHVAHHAPEPAAKPVAPVTPPPLPAYGSGSFFDRPVPPQPVVASVAPSAVVQPQVESAPTIAPTRLGYRLSSAPKEPAPAATGDWRKDALARFKKMPDLSK